VPNDINILTTPILEVLLPGELGMYIYPIDAVFHLVGRKHTRLSDLDAIKVSQKQCLGKCICIRMNHLTLEFIRPLDDADGEEDEVDVEEEDREDRDDENEDDVDIEDDVEYDELPCELWEEDSTNGEDG